MQLLQSKVSDTAGRNAVQLLPFIDDMLLELCPVPPVLLVLPSVSAALLYCPVIARKLHVLRYAVVLYDISIYEFSSKMSVEEAMQSDRDSNVDPSDLELEE